MAAPPVLLLVDDEARILSAIQRALRREGYEILTAGSGEDALAILAERRVDLVLSDHKMPRMSGLELIAEVTRLQPRAGRILITGWTEEISGEEVARLGIAQVLTKPWDAAELKAAVRAGLTPSGAG